MVKSSKQKADKLTDALFKRPVRMSIDDIPLDAVENQMFNLGNIYVGVFNPQQSGGADVILKMIQKLPQSERNAIKKLVSGV